MQWWDQDYLLVPCSQWDLYQVTCPVHSMVSHLTFLHTVDCLTNTVQSHCWWYCWVSILLMVSQGCLFVEDWNTSDGQAAWGPRSWVVGKVLSSLGKSKSLSSLKLEYYYTTNNKLYKKYRTLSFAVLW